MFYKFQRTTDDYPNYYTSKTNSINKEKKTFIDINKCKKRYIHYVGFTEENTRRNTLALTEN